MMPPLLRIWHLTVSCACVTDCWRIRTPDPMPPLIFSGSNLSTPGTLNVWIDGTSLCNPTLFPGCGTVLFNGAPVATSQVKTWQDTTNPNQIWVVVDDPAASSTPNTIQVRLSPLYRFLDVCINTGDSWLFVALSTGYRRRCGL